jgi:hypothetical protein
MAWVLIGVYVAVAVANALIPLRRSPVTTGLLVF